MKTNSLLKECRTFNKYVNNIEQKHLNRWHRFFTTLAAKYRDGLLQMSDEVTKEEIYQNIHNINIYVHALEYMTYPRAIALSTALWSESRPSYESFFAQLSTYHFPFLSEKKVNFSKSCLKPNLQTSRSENGGIVIQKTAAKGIIAYPEIITQINTAKSKTKTVQIKVDQGPNLPSKEMNIICPQSTWGESSFYDQTQSKIRQRRPYYCGRSIGCTSLERQ